MPSTALDACAAADVHRRPSRPAIAADGTLRLVSAPDPAREVRAAARACLQWAREGVPFWEMAVAYRHGEAYRPLVEAVFVEAGIPRLPARGLAAGRAAGRAPDARAAGAVTTASCRASR